MIIYKYTNKLNGKIYIGQTVRTLEERLKEHMRKNKTIIDKALNKYGIDNFEIEILCKCNDVNELNEKEIYYIKLYNSLIPNGYNQCYGGGNTMGYHHKDISKQKMSEHKKGKKTGVNNPFYGKTHSEETKKRFSEQRKGRKLSQEWRDNIGKSQFKKVLCVENNTIYESIKDCGEKLGIEPTHITRVCKGKGKTAKGYSFKYI